jgi:hypothetical protein
VRFRRVMPAIVASAVVLVGLASVGAFQSATAPAATAAAVTGLPITSVYQVVADTAHDHLFISQGPDAPMVVTNLSGTPITTIGDGARGLALSENDETLYAATGDTVSAFSTTTLKETASYPTPGTAWQVALQSGRLWVSYQDDSAGVVGKVGAIDLAAPSAPWDSVPGQWIEWPPEIAVDPSDTGVLVTSSVGISEPTTASYKVSDPSAVTLIDSATPMGCGNNGLSVLPGGKTFLCDDYPYSTATLTAQDPSGTYATGFTAVAPNGAIAVGSSEDILAYPAGGTSPTESYDQFSGMYPPTTYTASSSPVGFAWAADSQQLFTVIESSINDGSPVFTVLSLYPFERVATDLTLTSTATTIPYDGSFTVTAHLGFTDSSGAYSVYQTIAGQPRRLDWSCPCGLTGSFITGGSSWKINETLTAVYAGNALYEPRTVTLSIKVGVKVAAALSGYYKSAKLSGIDYRVYHHTATLKDAVTVTPAKRGECVQLQVQEYSKGAWRAATTTKCGSLNKSSKATIALKPTATGRFRVRANFVRAKTDITNVNTSGSWLYYEVTK